MADINMAMEATSDVDRASDLDFQFHQALMGAAGNHMMSESYGMLRPVIQRLMKTGKSRRDALHLAAGEHTDILTVLREQDRISYTYHINRRPKAGLQYTCG